MNEVVQTCSIPSIIPLCKFISQLILTNLLVSLGEIVKGGGGELFSHCHRLVPVFNGLIVKFVTQLTSETSWENYTTFEFDNWLPPPCCRGPCGRACRGPRPWRPSTLRGAPCRPQTQTGTPPLHHGCVAPTGCKWTNESIDKLSQVFANVFEAVRAMVHFIFNPHTWQYVLTT